MWVVFFFGSHVITGLGVGGFCGLKVYIGMLCVAMGPEGRVLWYQDVQIL